MKFRNLSRLTTALLIAIAAVGSTSVGPATLSMLTYSTVATETHLQFDGRVGLRSSSAPSEAQAQKQIRKQIKFLQSNFRRLRVAAVRSDWKASVTGIESAGPGLYRIYYRFSATAVILNSMNSVEVILPVNPDTVETAERRRLCEDEHLGTGAFYYYWNPRKLSCPMIQGSDFLSLHGEFSRSPNTVRSYPEYNRLFEDGESRIVLLLGKVYPTDSDDPKIGNPWSFPVIQNSLRSMGFTSQIVSSSPYIEEYRVQTPRGLVSVTIYFGDTGLEELGAKTFHGLLKNSFETADVIMYGGHAGTGKNLDFDMIKSVSGLTIRPPPNKYQMVLLSACFPYSYYAKDLLATKATSQDPRGSQNLDVIAEAVEGGFEQFGPQMSNTIKAIVDFAKGKRMTSYQELLNSHQSFSKAMMTVVGDEDNSVPRF